MSVDNIPPKAKVYDSIAEALSDEERGQLYHLMLRLRKTLSNEATDDVAVVMYLLNVLDPLSSADLLEVVNASRKDTWAVRFAK